MLAISVVGTGLYAGLLGAGAAAESGAPAIVPDASPEPVQSTEANSQPVDGGPEGNPPASDSGATNAGPEGAPTVGEPGPANPGPEDDPTVRDPAPVTGSDGGPADPPGAPADPGPVAPAEPPAPEPEATPPDVGGAAAAGDRVDGPPPPADDGVRDNVAKREAREGRRGVRERQHSRRAQRPSASPGSDRVERERGASPETPRRRQADPAPPAQPAPNAWQPPSNPTFSLIAPTIPNTVPDFFVARFRVPPVLLPLYRAAGIRYGVRWEVLAAINEIETDYGRNLGVSSAGALGWMQFMPATWKAYGVDANRDGVKDPYDPSDAIFAAARYLRAAGAAHDLPAAIYAYNHADWYVDSVLERARLITALPHEALASLTGLGEGRLPVARTSRTTPDRRGGVLIFARSGTPVVAVNDGRIAEARHGRYVKLRDRSGNTYVYRGLEPVARASRGHSRPRRGARVVSGTVLGRVGREGGDGRARIRFAIRPTGRRAPRIDPRPILDGWSLSRSTAIPRAAGDAGYSSSRRILAMDEHTLATRVLADPRIQIYACGRDDIRAGTIDRRVLATLELLAASGFSPTVSSLTCGHSVRTTSGNVSEHTTGSAVDIAAINGVPIMGHQGAGSITELVVRRLLELDGPMKPHQIITLMRFAGADNTVSMPDHADHIHIGWRPQMDSTARPRLDASLDARQWIELFDRLGKLER